VALILGAAPRLGDMLARQPQIMDGLIDPRFFGANAGPARISRRLAATLADANSYEEFLDRPAIVRPGEPVPDRQRESCPVRSPPSKPVSPLRRRRRRCSSVHGLVTDRFAAQHGRIKRQGDRDPGNGPAGSREMTASSDLDLILLYDFDSEDPDSDGANRARRALFRAASPSA